MLEQPFQFFTFKDIIDVFGALLLSIILYVFPIVLKVDKSDLEEGLFHTLYGFLLLIIVVTIGRIRWAFPQEQFQSASFYTVRSNWLKEMLLFSIQDSRFSCITVKFHFAADNVCRVGQEWLSDWVLHILVWTSKPNRLYSWSWFCDIVLVSIVISFACL